MATQSNKQNQQLREDRGGWQQKHRRELWMYLAVGIISINLLVTVAAVCYGFIMAQPDALGVKQFRFPLLLWLAGVIMLPAALLLSVHYANVGLFKQQSKEDDEAWQQQLPERLQRLYRLIKGAPVVVIFLALLLAGVTLFTIDGAMQGIFRLLHALMPYIPYLIGGVVLIVCCITVAMVWLRYQSRRLGEEYAFRREVFERSGLVIVDKSAYVLGAEEAKTVQALEGVYTVHALEGSDSPKGVEEGDNTSAEGSS